MERPSTGSLIAALAAAAGLLPPHSPEVSRIRPLRFIDLCNNARRRAGLPEKKERSRRRY